MRIKTAGYAAIDRATIDISSLKRGALRGYAAPERGPKPCLVELVAGDRVLAMAPACGFSDEALAAKVRFGWCGFELGGFAAASALGEMVHVRCAVSGEIVGTWTSEDLSQMIGETKQPPMKVSDLRTFIRGLSGCTDLMQIIPFGERYQASHGDRALIEASYLYLHKRKPSAEEVERFMVDLPTGFNFLACCDKIVKSYEFESKQKFPLPGIFSANFPFGLSMLD